MQGVYYSTDKIVHIKECSLRFIVQISITYQLFRCSVWICHIIIKSLTALTDMIHMMTSSNGNIFRVTGHLCGEFTGDRWIPRTKVSNADLWCFLWSPPWINGWVNNREAGDLRRHRSHYDVIIMYIYNLCLEMQTLELLVLLCIYGFTHIFTTTKHTTAKPRVPFANVVQL